MCGSSQSCGEKGSTYLPHRASWWDCLTRRHRLGNGFRTVWNVLVVKLLRRSHPIPKTADETTALVDTGDVHAVMIGAAGVGKTAYWLYPCLEYALASGMSFLSTDTKGDVVRNYGRIAQECYGYRVGVIDLRNPTSRMASTCCTW